MANVPKKLQYTSDHEWVSIAGNIATIGITHHAQDQLGDIVFLGDTPDPGTKIEPGDVLGVVESVKATSDIYSPLDGRVTEVNEELEEEPELVNADPYGRGWIVRIKVAEVDPSALLSAEEYEALLEEE